MRFLFLILTGVVLPLLAFAQRAYEKLGIDRPPIVRLFGETESLDNVFLSLLKWFYSVFWITAVGFVIWAAFTFLFADGDEGKVGEAKNRLKYAVIAAIIGLLSFGLDVIVKNILSGA